MPREKVARCHRAALVCICIGIGVGAFTAAARPVPSAARLPTASETVTRMSRHCAFSHRSPDRVTARQLGAAVRCLINRRRRSHGLVRLVHARALDRIARRYADDMRNRGYFGHVSPDGQDLGDRMRSAGLRAAGEVLAWGCGTLSTPAAAVRGWLASPPHRRVVLSLGYTVIGTGVADGAPGRACGPSASTSVALLGRPR